MPLNLAGADLKGFDVLPSGPYPCTVFEITDTAVKEGSTGTLPGGTPGINVQFRVSQGENENRRFFNKYWVAPAEIDGKPYEHKAKMDGMFARFFIACGIDEALVTSGEYEPDYEALVGSPICVIVGQKPKYGGLEGELDNEVKGVKPIDAYNAPVGASSGIE